MKLTLYEIHDELLQLFEKLEAAPDDELEKIGGLIQDMQLTWDQKLGNCCAYLKNLDAEITVLDAEIDKLSQKRDSVIRRYENFKAYLAKFAPKTRWKNGIHSIGWRESTRVEIDDDKLIPTAFKREIWKLEPDKKEIKLTLDSGGDVPGARLVTEQHLQVK